MAGGRSDRKSKADAQTVHGWRYQAGARCQKPCCGGAAGDLAEMRRLRDVRAVGTGRSTEKWGRSGRDGEGPVIREPLKRRNGLGRLRTDGQAARIVGTDRCQPLNPGRGGPGLKRSSCHGADCIQNGVRRPNREHRAVSTIGQRAADIIDLYFPQPRRRYARQGARS